MPVDKGLTEICEALPAAIRRKPGHRGRFFLGIAVAAAVVVFLGFARTYYLKSVFPTPSFPLLFHVHGALFTAWMLLLVFQAFLAASGRIALHRSVGSIARFLIVPMLVTGWWVAIAAARGQGPITSAVMRGELQLRVPALDFVPLQAMIVPLTTIILFAGFAIAGLTFRRRPETHKRLMALATIAMLPAALGRGMSVLLGAAHPALFFGAVGIFILAIVLYDRRSLGRVHPVTLWGGVGLMLSFPARMAFAKTGLWLSFAEWLVR